SSASELKPALCHNLADSQNSRGIRKAVSLNIAEQKNFPATPPELESVHQHCLHHSRWNISLLA
ncbi:MAG: hypothetical protein WBE44_07085, partial [Terriglobales bacterium]